MTKALVILSGGQDSATCAILAKKQFKEVFAISFNYGQKHLTELQSASKIARLLDINHEIIDLGSLILKSQSPLVSNNEIGTYKNKESLPHGVEPTFVAGRNILFLTIAGNRADYLGLTDIYTGVCQEDFGGYFDCRQMFIDKMQSAINEGIYGENKLKIHTPLMNLTKSESVKLAYDILGEEIFNQVFELTHTCYNGVRGGCGKCHACILRDSGFKEAGIIDPIWKFRQC
jgi:7-cyano-7-deazaguanine synthase